ncbi:MAG: AAA family ATPase [Acidimicrobiales bacterium]
MTAQAPTVPLASPDTNGKPPPRPDGITDAEWARLERIYAEGRYASDDEELGPTSWAPVDLTAALGNADVEPPSYLARSDGLCLLYPARVHAFQGESESLKSWAALLACDQTVEQGGDVLYIDFEDDARGIVTRLQALGLRAEEILARFVYLRPDEPLRTRHDEPTPAGEDLQRVLVDRSFALAVVDGVTEAMTIEGLDLMSNTDVATWMRRLPRRLARTGAAVVVIDHLPKDRTNQGRYSLGAQHKLAGLDGAAYKFQLVHYFARALGTDPVDGRALITVEKDRPGYVRGRCIEERVGELHLTSYPDGGVTGVACQS